MSLAGLLVMPFLMQASGHSPAACLVASSAAIHGTVRDTTGALIPGATLILDGVRLQSGADGNFQFLCPSPGAHTLSIQAGGFEPRSMKIPASNDRMLQITLLPASVHTEVEVTKASPGSDSPRKEISGDDLETLADDPDDLLRELQQLGAETGGSPANTLIAVNGFQGTSKLPPKSAIAYIEVDPDMYSAEYVYPPYAGGRVNVFTKAGQKTFHGALFATNGSPWENARDPFSPGKAALGKQRYGFGLTGPVRKQGSDFALDLEHRTIDNFAVVNAVTLNTTGSPVATVANVPTPQSLWEGEARLDWQLGSRNTLVTTFSSNTNQLNNVGVGGTMLAEAGYSSQQYDQVLRFFDLTSVSQHLVNEARVALRWDGQDATPTSNAPQLIVAGSFTGGGSTLGAQRLREFNLEADDDVIFSSKKHTLKMGTQLMLYAEHQQLTNSFNGTYTFGGGIAPVLDTNNVPIPGASETISGIEQYRRTLLGLPGGTPAAFSNVSGNPSVQFTQVQDALFLQDDINVGHGLHLQAGLRYALQNDPTTLNAITPRAGLLWSPKHSRFTLHARVGMFATVFKETDEAEVMREDGVRRITSTVYNPTYGDPFAAATPIHSARRFSPHISNVNNISQEEGFAYDLGLGFHVSASYSSNRMWNDLRTKNINAPLAGNPAGLRALGIANFDLLEMQNSAQNRGNAQVVDLANDRLKYLHVEAGAVRVRVTTDTDDHFFSPQSSFSDAGEFAQATGSPVWQMWGSFWLRMPRRLVLSAQFSASGDEHYNLTTGFDNNGDGNFNDRPQYASPGAPEAVATRYGLLTSTGGIAVLRRNEGVLPWKFYVDPNLQKSFSLTRDPKAEHQQRITFNIRSSNILNHTNVTQEGGVLGSPLFGIRFAADNGRRVEAGVRYSF